MISWQIVLQETKEGPAEVRPTRFFKKEDDEGNIRWMKVAHPFVTCIVKSPNQELKLRFFPTRGQWTIVHPDKEEYETFRTKGSLVPDVLKPKKTVKGMVERFDSRTEFRVRLERFMDQKLLNYIIAALESAVDLLKLEPS